MGSMENLQVGDPETHNCIINLRKNPERRKEKVLIGCGAGFGGDRPLAALKLVQRVKELNYLVLECLAERTLADRFIAMKSNGKGYDPRISEWMELLLPLAIEKGVCIITNMGAKNPLGAQEEVLRIASRLGINITVGLACQSSVEKSGLDHQARNFDGDMSVYLGASPIVECLERYKPNVVITSRVADASLFLAPMVYELGWNWDNFALLAQGTLAGHLLECGCQLTGGYYMHPGDKYRDISFQDLLNLSLPFAEISYNGEVCVRKAEGSGGILDFNTCAQQLLYEIGDPSAYITPDVIVDIRDVTFKSLSSDKVLCVGAKPAIKSVPDKLLLLGSKECGWKSWGEISYGGRECVKRAKAAEFLVRSWMKETYPDIDDHIMSYIIGVDSLKANHTNTSEDIRLRMDGLFELEEHAIQFAKEFTAIYTNGPAGGGGISTGYKKEIVLERALVARESISWQISASRNKEFNANNQTNSLNNSHNSTFQSISTPQILITPAPARGPARAGLEISLYDIAHSRAGDKGNDSNLSIIPHFPSDIDRLKKIITPKWVKKALSTLLDKTSFPDIDSVKKRDKWFDEKVTIEIYEVKGICSLNIIVRNILDGGVNCSRRIDRHGKTISDVILCQQVVLPQ